MRSGSIASVFDHLTIRVSDRDASGEFYRLVLAELGYSPTHESPEYIEWDDFGLLRGDAENPPTTGLHIGFAAASRDLVDAFWRAGTENGHRSDGEPGMRTQYRDDYYGAFLIDPDGNSVEAVHHGKLRHGGTIDHLWIRVSDLDAAQRFYSLVEFDEERRLDDPARVLFSDGNGSFSIVEDGDPARNVHVAFPAANDGVVDAFHARMMDGGYRDNGAPGPRPVYHEGYYGAFVLDPDGNNIERVHHNR
jgi:catechol 2,3-dioxygenase-like lactoylglutathione lyase family enzyme